MARTPGLDGSAPSQLRTRLPTEVALTASTVRPAGVKATAEAPVGDAFVSAPRLPGGVPSPADLPAEIPTGTLDFYKLRNADFVRRNPGVPPPDYYLQYGDKYCQKFSALGPQDLSPQGLQWRDATLKNLQEAIEQKRAADPVAFAQLERDPQAFKSFCYGTHADAYLKAGLADLPAHDLLKIAMTPATKDLLGPDGLKTIWQILTHFHPHHLFGLKATELPAEFSRFAAQA